MIVNALWAARFHGSIERFAKFHTVPHKAHNGWVCITQLADVVGYKATSRMTEARRSAIEVGTNIISRNCEDPTHTHLSRLYQHKLVWAGREKSSGTI